MDSFDSPRDIKECPSQRLAHHCRKKVENSFEKITRLVEAANEKAGHIMGVCIALFISKEDYLTHWRFEDQFHLDLWWVPA